MTKKSKPERSHGRFFSNFSDLVNVENYYERKSFQEFDYSSIKSMGQSEDNLTHVQNQIDELQLTNGKEDYRGT